MSLSRELSAVGESDGVRAAENREWIDRLVSSSLDDLTRQQEEWIVTQARSVGLTLEELAALYYIEHEPITLGVDGIDVGDGLTFRAVQRLRLRRRNDEENPTPDGTSSNTERSEQ